MYGYFISMVFYYFIYYFKPRCDVLCYGCVYFAPFGIINDEEEED